jgi:hypothetical protein
MFDCSLGCLLCHSPSPSSAGAGAGFVVADLKDTILLNMGLHRTWTPCFGANIEINLFERLEN